MHLAWRARGPEGPPLLVCQQRLAKLRLQTSFQTYASQSLAYAPAQDTPSVSPEESSQVDLLLEPFLIPKCKLNALTLGSHFNLHRTT